MYLSRIRLHPEAGKRPQFWKIMSDPYHIHTVIWGLFSHGNEQPRSFLYRIDIRNGIHTIYTVSSIVPRDDWDIWSIEAKPYNPTLRKDQHLQFMLRANPIRSKRDAQGKQHRHDVVMEAKAWLKKSECPRDQWPSEAELVQKEGGAWLQTRAEKHGFAINPMAIRAEGYNQHSFMKLAGQDPVRFSTIDFTGSLTVTDPERFLKMLNTGIGPAKGFGCGLMLVKPI